MVFYDHMIMNMQRVERVQNLNNATRLATLQVPEDSAATVLPGHYAHTHITGSH